MYGNSFLILYFFCIKIELLLLAAIKLLHHSNNVVLCLETRNDLVRFKINDSSFKEANQL